MNAPVKTVGTSVKRTEDARFLTGRGRYTDDINRPGQLYAAFVRSPHAHAVLGEIDTQSALDVPGVAAVFTGADMAADGVGGLPCGWQVIGKSGVPMKEPPHPPLAVGRVRHVGDTVAVVLAESRNAAKDGAEALMIDYDPQPAVVHLADAGAPGAAQVHDDVAGNVCYDWEIGDKAATDAAFEGAAHVTRLDLVNNRLIPNAIEPRAAVGEYDPADGSYTLTTTSQNPHVIRLLMCAFVLNLPEHKVRVVAPDVGGGFGSKIFHYAEEAVVTWAAAKVGRPIKWTAERGESFMTDCHGRDHVSTAELAMDADGTFLGLRVRTLANMGAYLSTFASSVPTYLYATLLAGQYRTPAIHAEVKALFTHTTPVDAYRGAGRPEATYLLEKLVEKAAREMKMDPAELRRKNFIRPDQFPYATPVALTYDTGDYAASLDRALELSEYATFAERRAASEANGKLRGVGFSCYIEACGIAPSAVAGALGARAGLYEAAEVRFNPTGSVTVFTGSHSHGQGHETTFAQIVADRLGVPMANVEIVHGDTNRIPFGMGTYGSRSLAVGGSAIVRAIDKIIDKGKKIAAHMLEAGEGDIEFKDGVFSVAGTDKSLTMGEIAFQAYVPHNFPHDKLEPGLDESAFYDPGNFTYPAGTYICEVEVDPDTGHVTVDRFTAVDDFGTIINPMIVEGQVHGGVAQGLGQALLEGCVYDDEGQLVTGSYMDYAMPRALHIPDYRFDFTCTPCTHNPLGAKGCGEAGAIGSPPAIINAIIDALGPLGVDDIPMPATPHTVWQAIQAARASTAQAAE
ncbi:xanthine dehydrogenase family protein molybdopterin-binding subunit [Roseospira marina]|uniref:Xanthine dehydrogenase family protein molybdopterin-binding subunit n=1 Tax=Roseospira marina TaxID=140057 RepID=A0A5M6I9X0_9PROT|nr:xanthine dehydrogenase family protein molybdopterin-binding subunit [Roseospira marina]KAA5604952.1 xanthine dehydrogenase family protein molybdopterin-binding subunit [Roseospira marina]MBB4315050.1 carbon-monoxide dehydrogenase large subunit [Roseospira marina]MBB5088050.1 carbon-monoxide dehydrogenase large subunit [Roseospira marina]